MSTATTMSTDKEIRATSFPWHELPAPALQRLAELCGFATVLALGCTNKAGQEQAAALPLHCVCAADSAPGEEAASWLAANCHRVVDLAGVQRPESMHHGPWPFPLAPSNKPWSLLRSISVSSGEGWREAFAGGAPQLSSISSGDVVPAECLEQYSSTLQELSCDLEHCQDCDGSVLQPLTALVNLTWSNCFSSDALATMSHLTKLTQLSMGVFHDDCSTVCRDIAPLASLTNLVHLDLDYADADDWSALAALTALTHLRLADSNFGDTAALAQLASLRHMTLSGSQVEDISSFAQLTNLEELHMHGTHVDDLSALAKLPSLKVLDMADTQVMSLATLDVARIANIDRLDFIKAGTLLCSSAPAIGRSCWHCVRVTPAHGRIFGSAAPTHLSWTLPLSFLGQPSMTLSAHLSGAVAHD